MSIEERAESIMLCLNNVCNTGYTVQKCDYDFIDKQIYEIKKEAADVQPVKRGKWVNPVSVGNGIIFCSVCRNEAYWDTDYGQQLFDFCPYCGARMDGEQNEDN